MVKKNNKSCIVCNAKYTFCTHCSDFDYEPRWKALFHDENCKKIFSILTEYNAGNIDENTAVKELKQSDLSNKNNFKITLQKEIDELLNNEEPVVSTPEEILIEEHVIEKGSTKRKMKVKSVVTEDSKIAIE